MGCLYTDVVDELAWGADGAAVGVLADIVEFAVVPAGSGGLSVLGGGAANDWMSKPRDLSSSGVAFPDAAS